MNATHDNPIEFVVSGDPVTQGSKEPFVPRYKGAGGEPGLPVRRHRDGCPGRGDKAWATANMCGCPVMVNVTDSSVALDNWRETVGWYARQTWKGGVLHGPLAVEVVFVLQRPKGHYGTGRNEGLVKDSALAYPETRPDLDKLVRAIGDALTGVLWRDDSQIVRLLTGKDYAAPGEQSEVRFRIWRMPTRTVGEMVEQGIVAPARPSEDCGEQLSLLAA